MIAAFKSEFEVDCSWNCVHQTLLVGVRTLEPLAQNRCVLERERERQYCARL